MPFVKDKEQGVRLVPKVALTALPRDMRRPGSDLPMLHMAEDGLLPELGQNPEATHPGTWRVGHLGKGTVAMAGSLSSGQK